jgi:integrase
MASITAKYYYEDKDRHGNTRRYFRKREGDQYRKVRLREKPGTPEFHKEFAAALVGTPYGDGATRPAPPPRVAANSLRWLVTEYTNKSHEFRGLDRETQKGRKGFLNQICNEPHQIGEPLLCGELPCLIPSDWISGLRDRKAATSISVANAWVKALRQMYKWAAAVKPKPLVGANTAKAVDLLKLPKTGGHLTWSIPDIEKFIDHYPLGTKEHLVLMLFLLLGQRISDISRLGKQHIRRAEHVSPELRTAHAGRWLSFRQYKNRNRHPVDLVIPILPQLESVLAASPCGALTFVESRNGKPYSIAGLGNWWADRCVKAGVPGRAHGLRKAGATIAAERGATPHQLMSIFGWRTLEQAELYTKAVRQQLLAGGAMNLIAPAQTANESDPPFQSMEKSGSISIEKISKNKGGKSG